jgi:hypothetical protein
MCPDTSDKCGAAAQHRRQLVVEGEQAEPVGLRRVCRNVDACDITRSACLIIDVRATSSIMSSCLAFLTDFYTSSAAISPTCNMTQFS